MIAHSLVPWSMVHGFADLIVTGLYLFQSIASRRLGGEALAERWQPDLVPYLYGDVLHQVPTLWQVPPADTPLHSIVESYTREELVTDQELFGLAAVHNTSLWPEELTPTASFENLARLEQLRMNHGLWRRLVASLLATPAAPYRATAQYVFRLLAEGLRVDASPLAQWSQRRAGSADRVAVCGVRRRFKAFRGGSVGRLARAYAGQLNRYDAGKIATRGLAYPMRLA